LLPTQGSQPPRAKCCESKRAKTVSLNLIAEQLIKGLLGFFGQAQLDAGLADYQGQISLRSEPVA
jgi:hypothetical protein